MNSEKSWYASRTIWANLLTMALGITVTLGFLDQSAADSILAEGPDLIVGLVTSVLGVVGIWGRVSATKQVKVSSE